MKNFNPKKNDKVLVCYDGKLGRSSEGVVLKRRGFALLVEFKEWEPLCDTPEQSVKCWFVRISKRAFGGYLRKRDSFMQKLVGTPGDWYSIYNMEDM